MDEADRAVAAGDLIRARECLTAATADAPNDSSPWLKLAAVERAAGRPRFSLEAVNRALALAPLDFTALLMKANLLDRMQDPSAPEAWGHALAQKPAGELPPPMQQALARGEQVHKAWLQARRERLNSATAVAEASANEDERHAIARFRTNALRESRPFHCEPTHYHYPGLREREFHPRTLFPWLAELEAATDIIAREFEACVASERAELAPYIQYEEHQPLAQWRALNKSADWTAIHLLKNGQRVEANADHCPETIALLKRLPQPHIPGASPNAMFSLLRPHTHIPPHVGIANTRLVCHLPLIVPEGCWFRVGAETRAWQRGEAFLFDDSIEHEAMNPTDQLRVVFILDVWHPDLSETERQAVAALIGSEGADTGL
jgi:aspartyl/asparaginyl beta-hydroxylase (cupin superfamily)